MRLFHRGCSVRQLRTLCLLPPAARGSGCLATSTVRRRSRYARPNACLAVCLSVCRRLQPVNQSGGRGETRTVPATPIEDPEWAERVTPPFGPSPRPAATRRSQRVRPQPRVTPNSIQKKAKFTSLARSLLASSEEAKILGRINKILNPASLKSNEYLRY